MNWGRSLGWNIDFRTQKKLGMTYTIITDGAGCYPWRRTFVIWPRQSVGGKPLFWTRAYKRKVWVVWGTGFHMEPHTQYATLFDMLTHSDQSK